MTAALLPRPQSPEEVDGLLETMAGLMAANTRLHIALDVACEQITTLHETIHALVLRLEAWERAHEGL